MSSNPTPNAPMTLAGQARPNPNPNPDPNPNPRWAVTMAVLAMQATAGIEILRQHSSIVAARHQAAMYRCTRLRTHVPNHPRVPIHPPIHLPPAHRPPHRPPTVHRLPALPPITPPPPTNPTVTGDELSRRASAAQRDLPARWWRLAAGRGRRGGQAAPPDGQGALTRLQSCVIEAATVCVKQLPHMAQCNYCTWLTSSLRRPPPPPAPPFSTK